MSIVLFISVIKNAPAIYEAEVYSLEVISSSISGTEISSMVLAAVFIPVAVCVMAFVIVTAGVVILIWTELAQQYWANLNKWYNFCKTVPWWQKTICWGTYAGLFAIMVAALGLFAIAGAIAYINIIVVVFALG